MKLWAYCYVSTASTPVSQTDLQQLLTQARRHNSAHDISGCLLLDDGHFAQVLEGDETVLSALMHRIAQDPRHEAVRIVFSGPIKQRCFDGWSMASFNLDGDVADGTISIQTLRDQLAEFVHSTGGGLARLPAFLRFCLACQRAAIKAEALSRDAPATA